MARIARLTRNIAVAALGLALTGCVTQEKYNALKLDRDALAEQLSKAQSDATAARTEADAYRAQLSNLNSNGNNVQALLANLTQQNQALQQQYDELNRRYMEAMNRPAGSSPLPQELTNTLQQFANQNPDLVDFDAGRGIVKFKSDVTFSSGDAAVTGKAKEVLNRFAQILNSNSAKGYELLVAGHTDNMRVSNPNTVAKGHKNNWFLSAHRAISVAEELMGQNVNAQRLGVIGYADQRPVASNGHESGRAQNRRVEVLILPNQVRGGMASNGAADTGNTGSRPNVNKDQMTGTNTAPVNK
jgi:chemotaxis protein MotB